MITFVPGGASDECPEMAHPPAEDRKGALGWKAALRRWVLFGTQFGRRSALYAIDAIDGTGVHVGRRFTRVISRTWHTYRRLNGAPIDSLGLFNAGLRAFVDTAVLSKAQRN